MAAFVFDLDPAAAEAHRRELLAESDRLLERIEQLRLMERTTVPPALAAAVGALQGRLGRFQGRPPRTVRAAQNLVFSLQQRLMSANPRHPSPRAHPGRPVGSSYVTRIPGGSWKLLALPCSRPGSETEWHQLVALTVERAFDRWSFAQAKAVAASRAHRPEAAQRVAWARAAWTNYWELRCEAERLLGTDTPRPQP